jgi:bla regulator protein blaR1
MLRTLLADRLKLVAHRETQELQAYTLVIGKNGSKMQEAKQGNKNYINWTGLGHVEFTECNMLGLINVLSGVLGSPVIDGTGLKGLYSFELEFADPRVLQATGAPEGDARPTLFAAVQDQLGLKLESGKGPAEVLVIDHIERPSEN